jgi:murein DD-endopeptidase MepM/ murein hydrolase activator NlpD
MTLRRRTLALLVAVSILGAGRMLAAQPGSSVLTRAFGRSVVSVETSRAQPGGVFYVTVSRSRWASASTLLDGRRASLARDANSLFGLIPVALDTEPAEHKLSVLFPGRRGRGGSTSLNVPVRGLVRPGRLRLLSAEALALASTQTALGHGRFLLSALRTRDLKTYHSGPLRPPVDPPISFPFGGAENYGMVMGPVKDGLMGEQHRGVDYEVPPGTTVKAPGAGIIILARSLAFSGETVVIGHSNGLVSVLSHLSHVTVAEGDVVAEGAPVGASGQSGLGALTPHLCFSAYLHSLNVDPVALMDGSFWPGSR